jgi:isoleucyl-tRNA synthetase
MCAGSAAYATKFIDIQRKEFMRLGCEGDWFDPYLTMAFLMRASSPGS